MGRRHLGWFWTGEKVEGKVSYREVCHGGWELSALRWAYSVRVDREKRDCSDAGDGSKAVRKSSLGSRAILLLAFHCSCAIHSVISFYRIPLAVLFLRQVISKPHLTSQRPSHRRSSGPIVPRSRPGEGEPGPRLTVDGCELWVWTVDSGMRGRLERLIEGRPDAETGIECGMVVGATPRQAPRKRPRPPGMLLLPLFQKDTLSPLAPFRRYGVELQKSCLIRQHQTPIFTQLLADRAAAAPR